MDEHIIVLGSYIGAMIYNLHDILRQYSTTRGDYYVSKLDPGFKSDNLNYESKKPLECIHLMKSCIVQAMTISYPWFAAASGNQIGLWKIDYIMDYIDEQNLNRRQHEQHTTEKKSFVGIDKRLRSVWHTKVDKCQSRITCVDMMHCNDGTSYLGLSCWDGSAFVFSFKKEEFNVKDQQWTRIIPTEPDFTIDPSHTKTFISWEDQHSDIMYPTFLTLFCQCDNDDIIRKLFAITIPGQSIVRCYDINKGSWCSDFIPVTTDKTDALGQGKSLHSYYRNLFCGIINITRTHRCSSLSLF